MSNTWKVTSVLITWFTEQNLLTFILEALLGVGCLPDSWQISTWQSLSFSTQALQKFFVLFLVLFLRCVYPTRNSGKEEGGPETNIFFSFLLRSSPRFWFLTKNFFPGLLTTGCGHIQRLLYLNSCQRWP